MKKKSLAISLDERVIVTLITSGIVSIAVMLWSFRANNDRSCSPGKISFPYGNQYAGEAIHFTADGVTALNTDALWDFGDESKQKENGNSAYHTYAKPGWYKVKITIDNLCTTDTAIYIKPSPTPAPDSSIHFMKPDTTLVKDDLTGNIAKNQNLIHDSIRLKSGKHPISFPLQLPPDTAILEMDTKVKDHTNTYIPPTDQDIKHRLYMAVDNKIKISGFSKDLCETNISVLYNGNQITFQELYTKLTGIKKSKKINDITVKLFSDQNKHCINYMVVTLKMKSKLQMIKEKIF